MGREIVIDLPGARNVRKPVGGAILFGGNSKVIGVICRERLEAYESAVERWNVEAGEPSGCPLKPGKSIREPSQESVPERDGSGAARIAIARGTGRFASR